MWYLIFYLSLWYNKKGKGRDAGGMKKSLSFVARERATDMNIFYPYGNEREKSSSFFGGCRISRRKREEGSRAKHYMRDFFFFFFLLKIKMGGVYEKRAFFCPEEWAFHKDSTNLLLFLHFFFFFFSISFLLAKATPLLSLSHLYPSIPCFYKAQSLVSAQW